MTQFHDTHTSATLFCILLGHVHAFRTCIHLSNTCKHIDKQKINKQNTLRFAIAWMKLRSLCQGAKVQVTEDFIDMKNLKNMKK